MTNKVVGHPEISGETIEEFSIEKVCKQTENSSRVFFYCLYLMNLKMLFAIINKKMHCP